MMQPAILIKCLQTTVGSTVTVLRALIHVLFKRRLYEILFFDILVGFQGWNEKLWTEGSCLVYILQIKCDASLLNLALISLK
jgi:hypothetical protein